MGENLKRKIITRGWEVIPPSANAPSRAMVNSGDFCTIYDAPLTHDTIAVRNLIGAAPQMVTTLEIVKMFLNDEPLDGMPLDVVEVLKDVERTLEIAEQGA